MAAKVAGSGVGESCTPISLRTKVQPALSPMYWYWPAPDPMLEIVGERVPLFPPFHNTASGDSSIEAPGFVAARTKPGANSEFDIPLKVNVTDEALVPRLEKSIVR